MQLKNGTAKVKLARRLTAGEPESFDHFIEHFRPKIFQYSWLMCGDREDAEEVAQDALLKVFQNLDQLREPERVRAWVFSNREERLPDEAPQRAFLLRAGVVARRVPAVRDGSGEGGRLQIADCRILPDNQVLRTEMRDVLQGAIKVLPESYRSVIFAARCRGVINAGHGSDSGCE